MPHNFSFKELYDVILKSTLDMTIGRKSYAAGEIVMAFDRIQIASLQEIEDNSIARGGWDNRAHIVWQHARELQLVLAQGVFSKHQFSLMNNSKVFQYAQSEPIILTKREVVESDEEGNLSLSYDPYPEAPLFIKDPNGTKIECEVNGRSVSGLPPFTEVIAEYSYLYDNGATEILVGQNQINGFLSLEGKTRVKDDVDGHTKTGILKIPRLRLMSDLSISLGANANPVVSYMRANGYPVGEKGNTRVMELFFLNDDIDSDM